MRAACRPHVGRMRPGRERETVEDEFYKENKSVELERYIRKIK